MTTESVDINTLQEKLALCKKMCINLQSEDRKLRRQVYIDLELIINHKESSCDDLRQIFTDIHMHVLNGLRDRNEKVREKAIEFITYLYIQTLPLNDYYLTYIFPILVERLGSPEIIEESEEIRLQLLEFLEKLIANYSNTPQLKPFLNDAVTILGETCKDKHPKIKELTCTVIANLAQALPEDFHLLAETLIKPLIKSCFNHQRFKVRVSAIYTVGTLIKHSTSHNAIDNAVGPLAEKLFDQIPLVRRAVAEVGADLLLNYRDRYSYFHKILPLILTGLNDEVYETRFEAEQLWHKVGAQYLRENEKDLKNQINYLEQKPLKYYLDNMSRPNLGCRVLVQRNVGKLASALSNELASWQSDVQFRCSQILCSIALHCEEQLTQHLQSLLPAMYTAARVEDSRIVENIRQAANIIGLFVRFETWGKLVLPVVDHEGHLMVLAELISGTPQEFIAAHLEEIAEILAQEQVCFSWKESYQKALYNCVMNLAKKYDINRSNDNLVCHLFKITLAIVSLKSDEYCELTPSALDALANATCESKDCQELWLKYSTTVLLDIRKDDIASWTMVSDGFHIFITVLMEIGEAFGENLKILHEILREVLDTQRNADVRLKIFWALSSSFKHKSLLFKRANPEDLEDFLEKLIRDVFVPSLIWHPGSSAEAIRTMAASCLRYALVIEEEFQLFKNPASLMEVFNELLPLLLSLMEDPSFRSRNCSLDVLMLLKEHCLKQKVWSLDYLVRIYPEILKRLDDPVEQVRLEALQACTCIFSHTPPEFKTSNYKAHHDLIIDTLLTHFDDEDEDVQSLVSDILVVFSMVSLSEVVKKLERHEPLLRNKDLCRKLLNKFG